MPEVAEGRLSVDPGTSFTGQTVVVTGAARGAGLAIARRFAEAGAYVVLVDRDLERTSAVAAGLSASGFGVAPWEADVRSRLALQSLAEGVVNERGRIDVWVNAPGIWYEGPAEIMPEAWWDETLAVILSGSFYGAQAAAADMLARRRGVIVNIASVEGLQPTEGHVGYSAAMAGLIRLTEALGIEWASRGVRVVGIAPGVLDTGWLDETGDAPAQADLYRRRTPMRRLGLPSEVAEAVLYLASDEASYITAETLPVDGGWTAYQLF